MDDLNEEISLEQLASLPRGTKFHTFSLEWEEPGDYVLLTVRMESDQLALEVSCEGRPDHWIYLCPIEDVVFISKSDKEDLL